MRRFGLILGSLLLGILLVLIAGFGLLQTGGGKRWLAATLNGMLANPKSGVTIGRIDGLVPFDLTVSRIELTDRNGPWLTIDKAALAWSPSALLRGLVRVDHLTADRIDVLRAPEPSGEESSGSSGIPKLPVGLELRALAVGTLAISPALAGGENAAATLHASGRLTRDKADLSVDLGRADGQPGAGAVRAHYDQPANALTLKLSVDEPTGILLDAALARTDHRALRLTLDGAGPLSGWKGQLAAQAGADARVDSTIEIAQTTGTRLVVSGTAAILPLLPDNARPIVGEAANFSIVAAADGKGGIMLAPSRINLAVLTIEAEGSRSDAGVLAGKAHVALNDLATAGPLVGTGTGGAVTLDMGLAGTADAPELTLKQQGTLSAGGIALEGLGLDAHVAALKGAPAADPRFAITADVRVESVRDQAADKSYGGISLHFAGTTDARGQLIDVTTLNGSGAGLALDAQGRLSNGAAQAKATIDAKDLSVVGGLLGVQAAGAASIKAIANTTPDGATALRLDVTGTGLKSGIAIGDAIVPGGLSLTADGVRGPDGVVSLSSLAVDTGRMKLQASGRFDPAARSIDAAVKAVLADLGTLSGPLATPLSGTGEMSAKIGGTLDRPTLDGRLVADRLAFGAMRIDHVDTTISAPQGLDGPARIDAKIDSGALHETLAGSAAKDGARFVIPALSLAGTGGTASARVAFDPTANRASGKISAAVPDLSLWSSALGQSLGGRLAIDADLPASGAPGPVSLTADHLAIGHGPDLIGVTQLHLAGQASGNLAQPAGSLTLTATGIAGQGAAVERASAQLSAAKGTVRFALTGNGKWDEKFTIDLAGAADLTKSATELKLDRLAAVLGANRIALNRPLAATLGAGTTRITGLNLAVDSGTLRGDALLSGREASADFTLSRLPLHPIAFLAGKRFVAGTLDGRLTLSGTPARPVGRVTLVTDGLDLETDGPLPRPKLGVTASVDWQSGVASLKARLASGSSESLVLAGSVPLDFDLVTFAPRPHPGQSLSLKLTGGGRIENLASIVPLGEDRVSGGFAIDLGVSGTLAAPHPNGRITVTGGHYANMALGTEIDALDLSVTAAGDKFVLERMSATDGRAGKLSANGAVTLDPAASHVDVKLAFDNFLVARSDDMTVNANGALQVAGSLEEMKVSGRLGVARAELYIPDRLPANVVKLDVIEVGGRQPAEAPKAKPVAPVALEIALDAPGQIFVRGRGVTSEWRGRLDIGGSTAAPVLVGQLTVLNGNFGLLGQNFNIDRGIIRFEGGSRIDPALDVQASATASSITALVNVTGTAGAPKLALSSTPALPRDEILSRVLFGSNVGSLTPSQGIQLAAAAAQLTQGGPGVLDRVRTSIGLDRLDIGSGGSNPNGTQGVAKGTTVTGGKYIANGVFVGVSQGLSGESQARVEVEVTPNISVTSSFGAKSGSGVGAKYSIDY